MSWLPYVTLLSSEVHICFCRGSSFRLFGLQSSFFTNDDELFIKTKITFFANVAIGFTFL